MDDDLDAFFDDVETAVKEVQQEEAEKPSDEPTANDDEPPPKRLKVTSQHQQQPVKAVVASSVPVKSIVAAVPPPPPASTANKTAYPSSSHHVGQQPTEAHLDHNNNNIPPPPPANNNTSKPHVRSAAGQTWTDPTLTQWPANDFRLFVGNLPKDLKQHQLESAFAKYPSFQMARIVYDRPKIVEQQSGTNMNEEGISRGYGFVSVSDPKDCARAIREMDQSWLGSRPIKVKRSEWREREWKEAKKRDRYEKRRGKGKTRGFGL